MHPLILRSTLLLFFILDPGFNEKAAQDVKWHIFFFPNYSSFSAQTIYNGLQMAHVISFSFIPSSETTSLVPWQRSRAPYTQPTSFRNVPITLINSSALDPVWQHIRPWTLFVLLDVKGRTVMERIVSVSLFCGLTFHHHTLQISEIVGVCLWCK